MCFTLRWQSSRRYPGHCLCHLPDRVLAGKRRDSHHDKYCRDKDRFDQMRCQFHSDSPFIHKCLLMQRFNILIMSLTTKCAKGVILKYLFEIR